MLIAVATVCGSTRWRRAKPSRKLCANGAAPSAWTAARRGSRSITPHSRASVSAFPNAAVLPRFPGELLQQLEDDRLLALEPERIDRVEEIHAEPLARLVRQLEALVEVAPH